VKLSELIARFPKDEQNNVRAGLHIEEDQDPECRIYEGDLTTCDIILYGIPDGFPKDGPIFFVTLPPGKARVIRRRNRIE
jgi:hypothetical protein